MFSIDIGSCLAGVIIALLALAVIALLWRQARYERQLARLMNRPKNFDLAWGDLNTGLVHSKSSFSLFRKWGLPLPPDERSCALETLGAALGHDLHRECSDCLAAMKEEGRDSLVSEKSVYSPQEGRHMHYRRHLHHLGGQRFMCCLEDVTLERLQSDSAPEVVVEASPQLRLSELLTRRGMSSRLSDKCSSLQNTDRRAFLIMLDLDNFRKINESYGHDVGDAALRAVSNIIRSIDNGRALTARWGGEEYLIAIDRDD
ncbi:MAG: GGDEF domain-containing protein [Candidatus Adiutrix sp.]|nr:GGDEF domain-containing protein [Candidatus Adiutrix sp.]